MNSFSKQEKSDLSIIITHTKKLNISSNIFVPPVNGPMKKREISLYMDNEFLISGKVNIR